MLGQYLPLVVLMVLAAVFVAGSLVTSWLSMRMVPDSDRCSPATTLSSVDLPAPFEPITVTKSRSASVSDRSFNATFSLGVCQKKILVTPRTSSTDLLLPRDPGEEQLPPPRP